MVFGQMNEPPGARLRVGLTGLTMAEYFRDEEGRDVLLFIDNIFRFTQAGSEVSALLGRMPSAVGYQPTLATEMGELQERITSTKKGSITSLQAVYVPADDYTDPAPATTFAHLDATDRARALARRARRSTRPSTRSPRPRRMLDPLIVGAGALRRRARSAARAAALQGPAGHHRHPRHRRAVRRGQADRRPRAQDRSASSRSRCSSPSSSPARPASTCSVADTVRGFKEILEGKHDDLPGAGLLHRRHDRDGPREGRAHGEGRRVLASCRSISRSSRRSARSTRTTSTWSSRPASEGYVGILPHHVPLFTTLGPGEFKVKKGGVEEVLAVFGGFMDVARRPGRRAHRRGRARRGDRREPRPAGPGGRSAGPRGRPGFRRGRAARPS